MSLLPSVRCILSCGAFQGRELRGTPGAMYLWFLSYCVHTLHCTVPAPYSCPCGMAVQRSWASFRGTHEPSVHIRDHGHKPLCRVHGSLSLRRQRNRKVVNLTQKGLAPIGSHASFWGAFQFPRFRGLSGGSPPRPTPSNI